MVCKLDNNLRQVREQQGISVSELARITNISRQTIINIELHGQEPGGLTLLALATALNKDPRDIFHIHNEKEI